MKTMDAIQARIGKIGEEALRRLPVAKARKAVRRGAEQTATWVRKNPAALPLAGLGGAPAGWIAFRE